MDRKTRERVRNLRRQKWTLVRRKAAAFFILCGAALIAWGAYRTRKGILDLLWNMDYFRLREIRIYPAGVRGEITGIIELEKGKNLLFLNIDDIVHRVDALRIVERSRARKILPASLEITVQVRKAWVLLARDDGTVAIDRGGIIVPIPPDGKALWHVTGVETADGCVAGEDMRKIDIVTEIEKWYNFHGIANFFSIRSIDVSNPQGILLKDGKREILLHPDNLRKKFEELKITLIQAENEERTWEYIDLRFNRMYMKPRTG